ncbi:serine/threonine-protein kinase [Kibdelosporangium persicum]|uniref:non-specific serine/threonine protein kinase n=1 Tax=Kibdelosporangium persicum TaxID=2698649 RepID=A0ABX2F876_9PSEU|nr:serine/threonine-protein kinase [Kibdelosporangium persicum]NRN67398.1 Serine/threonine protein kinase [Kibdelosporangium persicum]
MTEGEGKLVGGRYRLAKEPIGHGGMGAVWRAHDEYLHRDVAIKELTLRESYGPGESESAVRRMLREARAAAKLRHPGIVTVHDVVTEDGLPWIVMELIEGRSLADILNTDGPLPIEQAAQVGLQVLRALDAAHQRGVLHRDVKPGNIMIDGERVVLTDFGIAVMDGASALTGTGQMPGSPEFIAPERIDGREATRAADIWSVGVTLYSAVVGRSPFKRNDIQSTLAAAASREPDPDPRIGRLWPVIQGLLRKQPAERMAATDAIDRLVKIAGPMTVRTDQPKAPAGPETWIDVPSDQITIVDETTPNTRTAPPLLPVYQAPAVHGDITLDPIPLKPPRKHRGLVISLGALLVVAIAVVVVALTGKPPPVAQEKPQQPTSTTPPRPKVPLVEQREVLGFTIGVPADWTRSDSTQDTLSDVLYVGKTSDPKVGAPEIQIRRDNAGGTATPKAYIEALEKNVATARENLDFQPHFKNDNQLEYEYRTASGDVWFHVMIRVAGQKDGALYILRFTQHAADRNTLRAAWDSVRPVAVEMFDSFRLNTT